MYSKIRSHFKELIYFLCWFIFIYLVWSKMFYFDGKFYWAGYVSVWGDWSTHLAYIANFANRNILLPYNPQYSGEHFRYHFAADLISGILMKLGLTITQATVLPSFFCTIALIYTVYVFYLCLHKKKSIAIVSSLLFFFNGGFGIFIFLFNLLILHHGYPTYPPLFTLTRDDASGIRWMNFFLAEFIPQRAFLLGAPITIYVLTQLWHIYESGIEHITKKKALAISLITGVMPLIHFHSFFVLVFVLLYIFIYSTIKNRKLSLDWVWLFLPAILTSFVLMYEVFGGMPRGSIRFQIGSIGPANIFQLIWFWFLNTGVMSLLIPFAFFKSSHKVRVFYYPFLTLFILSNLFVFQSDPWDNRKFLLYWYLLSAGLAGSFLVSLIQSGKMVLAVVLLYFSIISGLVDCVNLLDTDKQKYQWFSKTDMEFSKSIRAMTDKNAIFLTAPTNTFVTITLGRQIVMGWDHWLQNYGYATKPRRADIDAIYTDLDHSSELIKKYSIDYIVVGETERKMYTISTDATSQFKKILLKDDNTVVYDVRRKTRD